jgi:lysozyme family protein
VVRRVDRNARRCWRCSGGGGVRAANALHPDGLKRKILAQRLRFMATLPNWPAFGRGWANRISDLLET